MVAYGVQEAATLVFTPGPAVLDLQVTILLICLLAWCLELFGRYLEGKRLLVLGCYLLLFSFQFSPHNNIQFRLGLQEALTKREEWFWLSKAVERIDWRKFHFYLFGTLLCLNEGNLLVRFAIENLKIRPGNPVKEISDDEYNRGRIIGYLERVLFFFFLLQGQYTVLGFVISAKTIARFKALDDRSFAEYFIIGTMLSVVIAGGIGLLIRYICPI